MQKWIIFCAAAGCLFCSCTQTAPAPPPPEPTWSVCTSVEDYPKLFDAGYDYIEPTVGGLLMPSADESEFTVQREFVRTLDARVISCTIFLPRTLKAVGHETHHDEIMEWAETTFRRAQELEIPYIVFGSGRSRMREDDFSYAQARTQFVELCRKLGPLAEQYHVTVLIEPLNRGETNFINSLAEGADVVTETNHPNVQLLCDIFHMLRENEPAEEIVKYGQYIKHCHIAEKENRTAPGMERFDFTAYFDALKEIGYAGCISVEGTWGEDMDTQLAPTLQYMKEQYTGQTAR